MLPCLLPTVANGHLQWSPLLGLKRAEEALNQTRVEINDTRAEIIKLTNELRGEPQPDKDAVKFLRQSILSKENLLVQRSEKENLLLQQQSQRGEYPLSSPTLRPLQHVGISTLTITPRMVTLTVLISHLSSFQVLLFSV